MALNPNDTELLAEFGSRVGQAGDGQRGRALIEQALARNPAHSGYYNGILAQLAYMVRDYERAENLMRQVSLEKFPLYHFVAAIIYAQLGMKREAAEARDRFLQMRPTFFAPVGSRKWPSATTGPRTAPIWPKARARPASRCRTRPRRKRPFGRPSPNADSV